MEHKKLHKDVFYAAQIGMLFLFGVSSFATAEEFVTIDVQPTEESIPEYWTPQRMKSAKPAIMPSLDGNPSGVGVLIAPNSKKPAGKESGTSPLKSKKQSVLFSGDASLSQNNLELIHYKCEGVHKDYEKLWSLRQSRK